MVGAEKISRQLRRERAFAIESNLFQRGTTFALVAGIRLPYGSGIRTLVRHPRVALRE
jgi:hypothetical protein